MFCSYVWKSKIPKPVSCPKCKKRFDYVPTLRTKKFKLKTKRI